MGLSRQAWDQSRPPVVKLLGVHLWKWRSAVVRAPAMAILEFPQTVVIPNGGVQKHIPLPLRSFYLLHRPENLVTSILSVVTRKSRTQVTLSHVQISEKSCFVEYTITFYQLIPLFLYGLPFSFFSPLELLGLDTVVRTCRRICIC